MTSNSSIHLSIFILSSFNICILDSSSSSSSFLSVLHIRVSSSFLLSIWDECDLGFWQQDPLAERPETCTCISYLSMQIASMWTRTTGKNICRRLWNPLMVILWITLWLHGSAFACRGDCQILRHDRSPLKALHRQAVLQEDQIQKTNSNQRPTFWWELRQFGHSCISTLVPGQVSNMQGCL